MLSLKQQQVFEDGSANYEFEFDKKFEQYYFKQTGKSIIDLNEVKEFIIKMLEESVANEGEIENLNKGETK